MCCEFFEQLQKHSWKRVCQESSQQWCFCEHWKLAHEKNSKHHILIRRRFYWVLKPLLVMFYRPFDRSMGLWVMNEFLKNIFLTCSVKKLHCMKSNQILIKLNHHEWEIDSCKFSSPFEVNMLTIACQTVACKNSKKTKKPIIAENASDEFN